MMTITTIAATYVGMTTSPRQGGGGRTKESRALLDESLTKAQRDWNVGFWGCMVFAVVWSIAVTATALVTKKAVVASAVIGAPAVFVVWRQKVRIDFLCHLVRRLGSNEAALQNVMEALAKKQ